VRGTAGDKKKKAVVDVLYIRNGSYFLLISQRSNCTETKLHRKSHETVQLWCLHYRLPCKVLLAGAASTVARELGEVLLSCSSCVPVVSQNMSTTF